MAKRKRTALVVLAVIAAMVLVVAVTVKRIESNLEKMTALPFEDIDISRIEDGIYTGSFSSFPVSAKVEVTIKGQAITGIELLKHTHGQGGPAEVLPGYVVEAQSLDVDVISGATYSSTVILKAIEDALVGAVMMSPASSCTNPCCH